MLLVGIAPNCQGISHTDSGALFCQDVWKVIFLKHWASYQEFTRIQQQENAIIMATLLLT